jgi:hypothetical protein
MAMATVVYEINGHPTAQVHIRHLRSFFHYFSSKLMARNHGDSNIFLPPVINGQITSTDPDAFHPNEHLAP